MHPTMLLFSRDNKVQLYTAKWSDDISCCYVNG